MFFQTWIGKTREKVYTFFCFWTNKPLQFLNELKIDNHCVRKSKLKICSGSWWPAKKSKYKNYFLEPFLALCYYSTRTTNCLVFYDSLNILHLMYLLAFLRAINLLNFITYLFEMRVTNHWFLVDQTIELAIPKRLKCFNYSFFSSSARERLPFSFDFLMKIDKEDDDDDDKETKKIFLKNITSSYKISHWHSFHSNLSPFQLWRFLLA